MTELDQRIALEELMGNSGPWFLVLDNHFNSQGKWLHELTLDWLHEVEKKLTDTQQIQYLTAFNDIIFNPVLIEYPDAKFDLTNKTLILLFATKHQRAEAILRVTGKWREG